MLLPALSQAREKARRSHCMSNLKGFSLGIELYTDENDGVYPVHGYTGVYLHLMSNKPWFRENYLQNTPEIMYCPSARYQFNHQRPDNPAGMADNYFGYAYWCGYGGDPRAAWAPDGWSIARTKYSATFSRSHALRKNDPAQVLQLSDNAGFGGSETAGGLRQEAASRKAMPGNNHWGPDNDPSYSVWENIVFLDGHGEGYSMPPTRPRRVAHWRVGNYHW